MFHLSSGVWIVGIVRLLLGIFALLSGKPADDRTYGRYRGEAIAFFKVIGAIFGIVALILIVLLIGIAVSSR